MTHISPFNSPAMTDLAVIDGITDQLFEFMIGDNYYIVLNCQPIAGLQQQTESPLYDFIGWLLKNN